MAKRIERNEWGLTAYQQKRYDQIFKYMDSTFDEKQVSINPAKYGGNLKIDLEDSFNVKNTIRNIKKSISDLNKLLELINSLNDFSYNENKIIISEDDANQYDELARETQNTLYFIKDATEKLRIHSSKLKVLEELENKKKNLFSKNEVMKDLLALDKEFVSMKFNVKTGKISAITEDIILIDGHGNEVNLGPFNISYIVRDKYLTVRSRAIQPVLHQRGTYFHPHIRPNGEICLGEAATMLKKSHADGDLYTIFITLKNLINTYNPNSPYVTLETWIGKTCDHCGANVPENRLYRCGVCDDLICFKCYKPFSYIDDNGIKEIMSICKTCQQEPKNQCLGYPGHECNNNVFGDPGFVEKHKRCPHCETVYKEVLEKEEKEKAEKQKEEELKNEIIEEKICASCNKNLINEQYYALCTKCNKTKFCSECYVHNKCDFCDLLICPDCMAPCSECGINTHIDCMVTSNINGNLICPICNEKKLTEDITSLF